MTITRACSNVLVAIAERWNTQRHCHDVFDRLSDAVLVDAIKLQATSESDRRDHSQTTADEADGKSADTHPAGMMPIQPVIQEEHAALENGYWAPVKQPAQTHAPTTTITLSAAASPLAVDNAFLHCYGDIQTLYQQQQLEDPVMHLSQDWLSYLGNAYFGDSFFTGSTPGATFGHIPGY